MSEQPETPKIEPGAKEISFCVFCGAKYIEPLSTNTKHTCPEDSGGCGRSFLVKEFKE